MRKVGIGTSSLFLSHRASAHLVCASQMKHAIEVDHEPFTGTNIYFAGNTTTDVVHTHNAIEYMRYDHTNSTIEIETELQVESGFKTDTIDSLTNTDLVMSRNGDEFMRCQSAPTMITFLPKLIVIHLIVTVIIMFHTEGMVLNSLNWMMNSIVNVAPGVGLSVVEVCNNIINSRSVGTDIVFYGANSDGVSTATVE